MEYLKPEQRAKLVNQNNGLVEMAEELDRHEANKFDYTLKAMRDAYRAAHPTMLDALSGLAEVLTGEPAAMTFVTGALAPAVKRHVANNGVRLKVMSKSQLSGLSAGQAVMSKLFSGAVVFGAGYMIYKAFKERRN